MLDRLFRNRNTMRIVLSISLASALVPTAFCGYELIHIHGDLVATQQAAKLASNARGLVDKISQSQFNLAAAPLELSVEERDRLYKQTDSNLASLKTAVGSAKSLTSAFLTADEQAALLDSTDQFAHSWEEIKDGLSEGMSEPEKAYHFLNIFDQAGSARDILVKLEKTATANADSSAAASTAGVNDVAWMLGIIFVLSTAVSMTALVGNYRYAASVRKANEELGDAVDSLKQRDIALRGQNERFNAALENMSQGLSMFDAGARLIVCNQRYRDIYALDPETWKPGVSLGDLLGNQVRNGDYPGGDREGFVQALHRGLTSKEPFITTINTLPGRVLQVTSQPMPEGGFVATHEDVTERKAVEDRIAHMAHHDALTGLPNRVLFREKLDEALARLPNGESFYVLCLDLDHFKDVNDTLGHPIGDKLLCAVSDKLSHAVNRADMVARLGGDEFAIIQLNATPQDNTALAQTLIDMLNTPFEIEGHQVLVGVSIGIAVAPTDGDDPDALLKAADMALYRAKTDGRGAYQFFEPAMDAKMQARRALELDLRKALPNGELEVYYQPLVNLEQDRISGFEALLRWHHPERGMISPAVFIPLAEEIGLITKIGAWVLKQACAEAATWPNDIRVAVNFSPAQFKSRSLILDITSALAASGLRPKRLEVEITESVMLQDTDAVLQTLHQIRELGVRISMDDFGTGYSSLSYLRKFPFDKIKIDQSFVRDLTDKADSIAIVKAVATMSASLGMDTVAEGVETLDQLSKVRLEGCTEVQGYLFSKPRPSKEIPELLASFIRERQVA
ncbi:MAG: putative diguanylate cyclase (GGDEF)/phosphodiesterase with sensor [Rhizobium sp.]|nr:putative diguanylate cyclase (GGDEF)/phosphodiesterase with sensor [Rhizobium sp.]